jgi:hypothetical protein
MDVCLFITYQGWIAVITLHSIPVFVFLSPLMSSVLTKAAWVVALAHILGVVGLRRSSQRVREDTRNANEAETGPLESK